MDALARAAEEVDLEEVERLALLPPSGAEVDEREEDDHEVPCDEVGRVPVPGEEEVEALDEEDDREALRRPVLEISVDGRERRSCRRGTYDEGDVGCVGLERSAVGEEVPRDVLRLGRVEEACERSTSSARRLEAWMSEREREDARM